MHLRRMLILLLSIFLAFSTIAARLAYIQLTGTESFSKRKVNLIHNAVEQRQQKVILSSGRGDITDRNGHSLTGSTKNVLVGFPFARSSLGMESNITELAEIVHVPTDHLSEFLFTLKRPTVYPGPHRSLSLTEEQMERVNALEIPGVIAVPLEERYPPQERYAQHLIGFVGQNPDYLNTYFLDEIEQGLLTANSEVGISGIERTFQPFLQGNGPALLSYTVDAHGEPIPGLSFKYANQDSPFYPLSVQSTLDIRLQEAVERVMDERHITEGTVVILDIGSSEVLALGSRPNYMLNKEEINSWENKALKRYSPGSVFKLVIAAAALEEGLVKANDSFVCNGKVEGTNFHCWLSGGHGKLTFEEAFAQSCNVVFGQLAQRLGPEKIEAYAHKLGLLEPNGWNGQVFRYPRFQQFDHEEVGQVFTPDRTDVERADRQYLLHTGIGQLDVQVTPLAVANMLATILKGGQKHQVKAVKRIRYQTGATFFHFDRQAMSSPRISPYTAYQLHKMMAQVVKSGTGQLLAANPWRSGGKTGTAQAFDPSSGAEHHHQWFAGYYPEENPRYAIVVLALNRSPRERSVAVLAFQDVVQWLVDQPQI